MGMMSSTTHFDPETALAQFTSPSVLLPAQLECTEEQRGEKRLMLAIAEEAISTYQRYADSERRRGQRLFREAEEWFRSTDTTWTFAFQSICHALGLDADYLRQGLERWKARHASGRAPVYRFRRVNGRRTSVVAPRAYGPRAATYAERCAS